MFGHSTADAQPAIDGTLQSLGVQTANLDLMNPPLMSPQSTPLTPVSQLAIG
jgi:hypothetical protein